MVYENQGLVIFLDALGTKDIQTQEEAIEMLQNWDIVYEVFKDEIRSLGKKLSEHDLATGVEYMGFSDTIIISLPVIIHPKRYRDLTNRDDYWWMINIIGEALIPLFLTAISKNILLRGAVSVGRFYRSDKMIIGPAVKDAADYYCKPKWIGICTAPTATRVLDKEWGMMGKTLSIFGKYSIPVAESRSEQGWALLWPRKDTERIAQCFIQEKIKSSTSARKDILLKYKHTLLFYDQFAN